MAGSVATVNSIFKSMDYGTVLESDKLALEWIKDQKFGFFIDGEIKYPNDRNSFPVLNPCTGTTLATVLEPTEKDVKQAILSASESFELWNNLGKRRGSFLYRIARNIQKHQQLLTLIESLQTGRALNEVKNFDIPQIIRYFYYYAGFSELIQHDASSEAYGVTVIIAQWNFPALHIAKMVAPALAAGNTVIVKVTSEAPLSAYLLADIIKMSGIPVGVFNLISGTTENVGKTLLENDLITKISFAGTIQSGIQICCLTAGMNKHKCLELNGKCALIVFDDVDQDSVVDEIINAAYFNNGQSNFAASRLLIQERIFQDIISKLKIRMNKLRIGNGLDKTMDFGAIINKSHLNQIKTYADKANKDGAKIFKSYSPSYDGNYFPPILITDLDPGSPVVLEEICGPILTAFPFRTAKEAVVMANNSSFGVAAGVFTENNALAMEVASGLKVGTVWINCYNIFDAAVPFGGCKQSGYGRHGGEEGLLEYLQIKQKTKNEKPETKNSEFLQNLSPNLGTYKMYIGGAQTRPDGNSSRKIFNYKNQLLAEIGEGSRKDIRNAVEAAQKAQISWAKRTPHNRAQILYYLVENLEERRSHFTGNDSYGIDEFEIAINHLFHWAACCDKFGGSVTRTSSAFMTMQVNEPIGVIGISCPESWPLLSFVTLVGLAVALGNTVVVIPNKTCPMPALDLIKVFDASDIPGGVINIVSGDQDILAETLAQHHDVNALWYFGNNDGCKKMEHAAAETLKRTWVTNENLIDWLDLINHRNYMYKAVNCKAIWTPMGESFAN